MSAGDTEDDPLLTGPEVAARKGITAATLRSLRRGGYAPPPDDPDEDRPPNRRRPRWRTSTIDGWKRPGPGARTDLVKKSGD